MYTIIQFFHCKILSLSLLSFCCNSLPHSIWRDLSSFACCVCPPCRGSNLDVCRWIFTGQTESQIFLLPSNLLGPFGVFQLSYHSHPPDQWYSNQDLANKVPSWLLECNLSNNHPMFWSPQIPHLNNHSLPPRRSPHFSHRTQDNHYCNDTPCHFLLKWKCTNRWSWGPLGKSILISMGNICLCALVVCGYLTAKFNIKG